MSVPMWPKKRAKVRALAAALGPLNGSRCLELGTKDGRVGLALRACGGRWVHADTDPAWTHAAVQRLGAAVVTVGERLPFPDRAFTVVVATDVLEHAPDDRRLLAEAVRCLAADGRLIVTAPLARPAGLDALAQALGLTDADFGHLRPAYNLDDLLGLVTACGMVIDAVRLLGGGLDEVVELAGNAVLARRRDGGPTPVVATAADWAGVRGGLGRAAGWIVAGLALLDRLPGMKVAATALVLAHKGTSA